MRHTESGPRSLSIIIYLYYVTNYLKLGTLKQYTFLISWFLRVMNMEATCWVALAQGFLSGWSPAVGCITWRLGESRRISLQKHLVTRLLAEDSGFSLDIGWSSWIFTTCVSTQGSLSVPMTWKLVFPRATDLTGRESQWERKSSLFYNLSSQTMYHHYCHILFVRNKPLNPAHTGLREIELHIF